MVRLHQAVGHVQVAVQRAASRGGHQGEAFRLFRCHAAGRLAGARRTLYQRGRHGVDVVARAHAGRPHQSLRAHLAAHGSLRFQTLQPRWARV